MSVIDQYKTFSAGRPWTTRILLALVVVIILLSLVRASLPLAVRLGAAYWFESNNIRADIDEVDISLLDGNFAIGGVSGKSDTGEGFSLGRLAVQWQWRPLLDRQIIVDAIEVSDLKLDAALYPHGRINIAGIEIEPTDETGQTAQVSETGDQPGGLPWDITIKGIALSGIDVCARQFSDSEKPVNDYCASLAGLDWTGGIESRASELVDNAGDTLPLYISGTLNLREIALDNNLLERSLLSVDGIAIEDVNVDTLQRVNIDRIAINKLAALQRKPDDASDATHVMGFDSLVIQPISLAQLNDLTIGDITLDGIRAYIHIDEGGRTEIAQWLPAEAEKPSGQAPEATVSDSESSPFSYALDQLQVRDSKDIAFVDDGLKERLAVDVHALALTFGRLDSQSPNEPARVDLSMIIAEHGEFRLDAGLTPLAERPSIDGNGEISGLDLRTFAPLSRQYIGHDIRSGQLDADLKLAVDKGAINSNIRLTLNQFELRALSKKDAERLNSEFGFPLNASLSLLRDRDNAIRLDIPVTGDIDNPEFSPNDAIVKATSKAITTAVIQYYTPFGLVLGAKSLFDLATALHFEPVVYAPGESELVAAQQEQLDKLAKLMTDRPGVHLTLCGISNRADLQALFPEVEEAQRNDGDKDGQARPEPPSETQIAELEKIASARSAVVKTYLVREKGIKASRLVECAPEYKGDNNIAGVEISI